MCFYEKSKMAASSHGSRRLTAEEVLEEVFADRDLGPHLLPTMQSPAAHPRKTP